MAVTKTAAMDTKGMKARSDDSKLTQEERVDNKKIEAKKKTEAQKKLEKERLLIEKEAFKPINGTVKDVETVTAKKLTRKFETEFLPLFLGSFEREKSPGEIITPAKKFVEEMSILMPRYIPIRPITGSATKAFAKKFYSYVIDFETALNPPPVLTPMGMGPPIAVPPPPPTP